MELEQFVQAHHSHGNLTWWSTAPRAEGYQVRVACPCGVTFERVIWGARRVG